MSALKVGLTGGLAAGKSTVASLLDAEPGFEVVDADHLVAELYRPGREGAREVARLFGNEVLDTDGGVDHARLAAIVFADPEARRHLEEAVHPLVRVEFARRAEAARGVIVLEATLLVEAGYGPDFDRLITVEASPEVRLRRAIERGLSPSEAEVRLAAQGDGVERRNAADHVVLNDGSRAELERAVAALAEELRAVRRRGTDPEEDS